VLQTYGLSHLQLTVSDLGRSVRFYQELFGMRELRAFDRCVMLQTPGTNEVLTLNADAEGAANAGTSGGIAHFGFRLRERVDMSKVLTEVARLGGKPLTHGESKVGDRAYAFATDPDGYEVEIFWEAD